jgi:hypothetical protein
VESERLDTIARQFVDTLPNALAQRVHTFLLKELKDAAEVFPAAASDDSPSLFVIWADGTSAECRVDPGGSSIANWGRLRGLEIKSNYHFSETQTARLNSWTLTHPLFTRAGTLTIRADILEVPERERVDGVLRSLLDPPS